MKVVLLGDVHHGIRSASKIFEEYQKRFYENILFPTMKDRGIDTIFQLGDFFDNRNSLRISTIELSVHFAFLLQKHNFTMYMPLGNHDVTYKNTNELNSPELIFGDLDHITVYSKPETISIGGIECDFIPWINESNMKESLDFINNSRSKYCFGHFDIIGGVFQKGGMPADEGLNSNVFKTYDTVFSGHYHTKSIINNVYFTGTPFEYTWADWNDPKGFYILDLVTGDIEFVENTERMFHKVLIRNNQISIIPPKQDTFKDKYIKVEIDNDNTKLLEKIVRKLNEDSPADIQTIIKQESLTFDINDDELHDMSISKLLAEYVNGLEIHDSKKQSLRKLIEELHDEATDE